MVNLTCWWGVNLLREGLDLPEVGLVAIMDGDKEGFLRTDRSLIQTAGRAARNSEGRVIVYGDRITKAIQKLLDETAYRRTKQIAYNTEHGITPKTIVKANRDIFSDKIGARNAEYEMDEPTLSRAAEEQAEYMDREQLEKRIRGVRKQMEAASKELDFIEAARLRDEMFAFQALLKEKYR